MDLLDDILTDTNSKTAKAGGKFQPKAKPRPVKKGPAVASSTASLTTKPTNDIVASSTASLITKLTDDIAKTDPSEASKTGKISRKDDEECSVLAEPSLEHPVVAKVSGPSICSDLDASRLLPVNSEDCKSCFEKSEGENTGRYIGLDSCGDLLPLSSGIDSSSPTTDPSAVHVAGAEKGQEQLPVPVSQVDDSSPTTSMLPPYKASAAQDPFCQGSVLPVSEGCQMELDSSPSFKPDILGATTSRKSTRRFQPKSKLQVFRQRHDTSSVDSDVGESEPCQSDSQLVRSELNFVDRGKEHGFPAESADDLLESSARGIDINIDEPTPEITVHKDYVVEASGSAVSIPAEHPEATSQPEELVPQSSKTKKQKLPASDLPKIGEENGVVRSSRRGRKFVNASKNESGEEIDDVEYIPEPDDSVTDVNDEDLLVENDIQLKKIQKKLKKKDSKEGKQAGKGKKTTDDSNKAANKKSKPKKFSHSTRQKRRRVDKALLEAPVDEIDYQKVPIKDLILLAEHKERLAKKDATAPEIPSTGQSTGASVPYYDEDETYASDEGTEANEHQMSPRAQDTSIYVNYQTYMDKTPTTRWSKEDTELFYEAVQQFGTDLSLIQQLFPGRTRRQLKLKYKKEERQHPFRLHDALTNRSKDHSHFERVIERLKQIEAEEMQKADEDIGEEEDTQQISEEEDMSEHAEEKEVEDVEQDVPEMQSPIKDWDSEDDWSNWKPY